MFSLTRKEWNRCRWLRPAPFARYLAYVDLTLKAGNYSEAFQLFALRAGRLSWARHRLPLPAVYMLALLLPSPVVLAMEGCADPGQPEGAHPGNGQKVREPSWVDIIVGEPSQDNLYLGMWSHHFLKGNEEYQTQNNLVGLSYHGYYFGTFINSYDDRAWSAGLQRDVYSDRWRWLKLEGGYRSGLLYGYDAITLGDTKLGPLFQLYADVSYRRWGLQFSWALEVVTAGFLVRLP